MVICQSPFDRAATMECSLWGYPHRVLREARGGGWCVVRVQRLLVLQSQRTNILVYSWINRIRLLTKAGNSKAERPTY